MIALTQQNWKSSVLDSSLPVLVDFWGPGCSPCKSIEPLLSEAARLYDGKVRFGKVDTSTQAPIARSYQVRAIPTLLLFDKGEVVGNLVGLQSKANILGLLQKVV